MFKPFQLGIKRLFSSRASKPSEALQHGLMASSSAASIKLHFWPPYPSTFGGVLFNPLFSRFLKGQTGHLSMSVSFSDGSTKYVSIWPEYRGEMHEGVQETLKPISESKNLESDIESESGRDPQNKTIIINADQEGLLKTVLNKFQEELNAAAHLREQWTLTNNCSTYIARLLYDSGISVIKPDMMETPRKVFYMIDEVEQKAYLENLREPSTKP